MSDDVVLITGGSSGIGLATARKFVHSGATVILVARDPQRLDDAVRKLGGAARGISEDIVQPLAAERLAADIVANEGRLDVLINCAGRLEIGPTTDLGDEVAEQLMEVNFLAPVRLMHRLMPLLAKGRRRSIVNVSSVAGKLAPPFMAAYAASKSALAAYSRSLRQEIAKDGYHVGLVMPGPVETPMTVGRVRTRHYPLPPGVAVISAEQVAETIFSVVERRRAEVVLPFPLAAVSWAGAAFPRLVDGVYGVVTSRQPDDG